eukprot:TRINITY_DN11967_c0_g1_i1.p1 TRINITY_DN11967_c0_g1~~TRINITY_DN11967_c0_g1_i1.p1  ORF type:complete len:1741 (-),score=483.75 TRINITY_DN11967_c0_g1_i1:336-5558(-)
MSGGNNVAICQFRVKCSATKPGESVFVVGSAPELGAWDPVKAVPCATTGQAFPMWTSADVDLPPTAGKVEFKIVVQKSTCTDASSAHWEGGGNKVFQVPDCAGGAKLVIISCGHGDSKVQMQVAEAPKHLIEEAPVAPPAPATPAAKGLPPKTASLNDKAEIKDSAEAAETPGPLERTASASRRMTRMGSRHLMLHSDHSINVAMSKTPSLMLVDLEGLNDEADKHEKDLNALERKRLDKMQRRMESGCLLEEMKKITDYADPSDIVMLQGFNWESWKAGKGDWYGTVKSKVKMLSEMGVTDVWLPPCSQSVAPQGYLPSRLFDLDGSAYGNEASLADLVETMHEHGMRAVADIVINHRCGDKQDDQGRWNVFTTGDIMQKRASFVGVMDWQGWAVTLGDKFSDGSGQNAPGAYDSKFDAAPDIDHQNERVQQSIAIWMRWLRLQIGFDAWRFDFVKGYAAEFVGLYCRKSEPSWAVGELWCDMRYDDNGLSYDQDQHRQDTCNWINATGKASTAFDFTTKGILQEAVRNTQYWRLKDKSGKPPGLIGWMPKYAVTFLDNHDTGSTQQHWPFPNDKVLVGYAYILTHPGIPSIFWDHMMDWGEHHRNSIAGLIKARRDAGVKADSKVKIECADDDLYVACIGEPAGLRVALGPRHCNDPDMAYWQRGPSGNCFKVWVHPEPKKDEKPGRQVSDGDGLTFQPALRVDKAAAAPAPAKAEEKPKPAKKKEPVEVDPSKICLRVKIPFKVDDSCHVVVCGQAEALGAWNPASAAEMVLFEQEWVLPSLPEGVQMGALFKYVVVGGKKPRWEDARPDRIWPDPEEKVSTHVFNSQDERPVQRKKSLTTVGRLPLACDGAADAFAARIADEDSKRPSYRTKLDLTRTLLENGEIKSLRDLACLQAYVTFVASGQIKCEEDGRHFRPNAAANAARAITEALWAQAEHGDADRFIARRIFPSLPSYSDAFTCAVPMTRIRDIAHRGDIPHDMKQHIKHKIQNKLHRCADPGDLKTLEELVQRVHREGHYSPAFVRELDIFYVELKEFFNAAGLDELARQVGESAPSFKGEIDMFLHLKGSGADPRGQLSALTALRRKLAPDVENDQSILKLELELEKYAFVLLSQVANSLENDVGQAAWWQTLLHDLPTSLEQVELAGISPEECSLVARDFSSMKTAFGAADKAFAAMRAAAAADRALRICFELQQHLGEAYAGVPALGKALRLDSHAVNVFVEAELRASVIYQVSKLAQLALQQAKVAAGLPLWTAISAGMTPGRVMRFAALADAWKKPLPAEGAVIFCSQASGDEELPPNCRGVVVGRDLPVLSHLALRARQLGAVFACTAETPLFEKLRADAKEGSAVRLNVEANGAVKVEAISEADLKASAGGAKNGKNGSGTKKDAAADAPKVGALSLKEDKVLSVIDIADKPQVAGSKAASAGKLEKLSPTCSFLAPLGLALPFGIMRSSLKGAAFDKALTALTEALGKGNGDVEACAAAVRQAVEACEAPASVITALSKALPPGASRVAVRSSANSEDLEKVSGAGLHDSVLGVDAKDPASLRKAVLQVWGSLFTLRAVQSRHTAGLPLYDGVAMGVLVQPMVSLAGRAFAFIAFSKDVIAGDDNAVYIELCVGLGETLASANEPGTPYRLVVKKSAPHDVKISSLATFSYGLEDSDGSAGPSKVRVDYSQEKLSTDKAFLEEVARAVAVVAVKVEKGYGQPMDLEGVVLEKDTGREIHLVQARPIVDAA